jgi:hypothetical protein
MNGHFHGYGEYFWASSATLYCGFWHENKRHGLGLLHMPNKSQCITIFDADKKHGCGILFASNGDIFISKLMFQNDEFMECKRLQTNRESIDIVKTLFNINELSVGHFTAIITQLEDKQHHHNESPITKELYPFHLNWYELNAEYDVIWNFVSQYSHTNRQQEFTSLKQFIKEYSSIIERVYTQYAEYSCKALNIDKRSMKVLRRIGLWQFMRDLKIFQKATHFNSQIIIENADIEFNNLTINANNPCEPVTMANFLNYLLYIVLHLNKHHARSLSYAINHRSKIFGLFATMCIVFVRDFLIDMQQNPLEYNYCGMIPKLIDDDKTFVIKFQNIIEFQCQDLTIRDVFPIIKRLKQKRNPNINNNNDVDSLLIASGNLSSFYCTKCCMIH